MWIPALAGLLEAEWRGVRIFWMRGASGRSGAICRAELLRRAPTEAVNYLHNLGHREFALIAGPQTPAVTCGVPGGCDVGTGRCGIAAECAGRREQCGGWRTGSPQQLLTARQFPTAILCSNDLTATSGRSRHCSARGFGCPRTCRYVGADDIPFAALTHPASDYRPHPKGKTRRACVRSPAADAGREAGGVRVAAGY